MKIEYDRSADAAYIYLIDSIPHGGVSWTYPCQIPKLKGSMINLDFDANNCLIGIEVLDASKHLPKKVLEKAELIG
jgi:uncharacterized protein YuzE